jgi:hypothetical protein
MNSSEYWLREYRVFVSESTNSGGEYAAYPHTRQIGKQKYAMNKRLMHPEMIHDCAIRGDNFTLFAGLREEPSALGVSL